MRIKVTTTFEASDFEGSGQLLTRHPIGCPLEPHYCYKMCYWKKQSVGEGNGYFLVALSDGQVLFMSSSKDELAGKITEAGDFRPLTEKEVEGLRLRGRWDALPKEALTWP